MYAQTMALCDVDFGGSWPERALIVNGPTAGANARKLEGPVPQWRWKALCCRWPSKRATHGDTQLLTRVSPRMNLL
jgi:hypothetical protein